MLPSNSYFKRLKVKITSAQIDTFDIHIAAGIQNILQQFQIKAKV
jgi:hypothetical protein